MATKVNAKDERETEKGAAVDGTNNLVQIGRKFLPHVGSAGVLLFSTNVTYPRLMKSLFAPNERLISNIVWFGAHIGTGYYIYSRRHMQSLTPAWRTVYATSGAVLFNFGTVLLWATAKALVPKNDFLGVCFGIASGVALLFTGHQYFEFVDSLTCDKKHI